MDLAHYSSNAGIPFTLSSNLVKALYISIGQKLSSSQYELVQHYGKRIFEVLNSYGFVPYSNDNTKVFTIVTSENKMTGFCRHMNKNRLLLSNESKYLKNREWCQRC